MQNLQVSEACQSSLHPPGKSPPIRNISDEERVELEYTSPANSNNSFYYDADDIENPDGPPLSPTPSRSSLLLAAESQHSAPSNNSQDSINTTESLEQIGDCFLCVKTGVKFDTHLKNDLKGDGYKKLSEAKKALLFNYLSRNSKVLCHKDPHIVRILQVNTHVRRRCLCNELLNTTPIVNISRVVEPVIILPAILNELNFEQEFQDLMIGNRDLVQRIPEKYVAKIRALIVKILNELSENPGDKFCWLKFFAFFKTILIKPKVYDPGYLWINDRINSWSLDWFSLFKDLDIQPSEGRESYASEETVQKSNIKSANIKIRQNRKSDALKILGSRGQHPNNASTLNSLQSKHPTGRPTIIMPNNFESLSATKEDLVQVIFNFSNGSSAGPSGFSPDMIKQLSGKKNQFNESFSTALLKIVNIILSGNIPSSVSKFFSGATLIALIKPDQGVRPIAIGEVIRRVCGKVAMRSIKGNLGLIFGDLQFGVNVSNGCESIVHSLNSQLESGIFHNNVLLKTDWSNAFNTIDRSSLFDLVRNVAPSISKFVESCYLNNPELFYFDHTIQSVNGVQQGDPLSPFLFCLIQQNIIKSVQDQFNLIYNKWYMDDGNMIVPLNMVDDILELIAVEGMKVGLVLNVGKCEVWSPNLLDQLGPDLCNAPRSSVTLNSKSGIIVLGGPVSLDPLFFKSFLNKKIREVEVLINSIKRLDNSQNQILLLRSCVAYPQLGYHIRVCPTQHILEELDQYDNIIREAIALIIGGNLDDIAKQQLMLPINEGGLGFQSISKMAVAAFLSSIAQSFNILKTETRNDFIIVKALYAEMSNTVVDNLTVESLAILPKPQKSLSQPIRDLQVLAFEQSISIASDSERRLAHWNSLKQNVSTKVFSATPFNRHRQIETEVFATMVRNLLGISSLALSEFEQLKCSFCPTMLTSNCTHDIDCKSNGVTRRHDSVRDCLASVCRSAGFGVSIEKHGLSERTREKPADVLIRNFKDGKDIWIDICVVNPLCPTHVRGSSRAVDYAIVKAEKRKEDNYRELVTEGDALFLPFVFDIQGRLNKAGEAFLVRLASLAASRNGDSQKHLLSAFRLQLSFKVLSLVAGQTVNAMNVRECDAENLF